jgi:hypothetical protein
MEIKPMKRRLTLTLAALTLVSLGLANATSAGERILANRRAQSTPSTPWHGDYYEAAWGAPVALVVPPTAEYQTNYRWGVGGYRVTPIYHQFQRGYPGPGSPNGTQFLPTPQWPSDTNQFGVYYVRGPW